MGKEKSLIFYQVFDSEFYHFKKQIKIMKKTDINSEKMKNLINNHSVQIIKSSASVAILSSANLINKNNKQKSDED